MTLCLLGMTVPTQQQFFVQAFGPLNSADTPGDQERTEQKRVAAERYRLSPLSFEVNRGQTKEQVRFLAKGGGYTLFLTETEAVFTLRQPSVKASVTATKTRSSGLSEMAKGFREHRSGAPLTLRMQLVGANRAAQVSGLDPLSSKSNYFIGNNPGQWQTSVPHYAKVQYRQVYPGIDLVYYGNQQKLEYDFEVAPGADPKQIKLAFEGARQIRIDECGELVLETAAGELRQHKPIIYQDVDGIRLTVPGRFVLQGKKQVAFEIGNYDRTRSLVIDPALVYSTYLGGLNNDIGNGIDVDAAGNAYITGVAYSNDFPTLNALQSQMRGVGNAFIAKLNPEGGLVYSTYLGGTGEDAGFALATDAAGNAYVAGSTDSSNFPISSGAAQAARRGRIDVFAAKLSPNGSQLLYSTFLGGQSDDVAGSVAVDAAGNVYVTGETLSTNFPVEKPIQSSLSGPTDAFVAKLNPGGTGLVYSTFLGGRGQEIGYGITVDAAGSAHVTGITYSDNFPTVSPVQGSNAGRVDVFVTKLAPAGNTLVYSTYLGGAEDDGGYGIGLDSAGNAYVAGLTASTNFPTRNPFQGSNAGLDDAFVTKLNAAGGLVFSSYLGGAADESAFDLATDASGNAYVVGRTNSTNFPLVNPLQIGIGTGQVNSATPVAAQASETQLQEGIAKRFGRDSNRWIEPKDVKTAGQQQQTLVDVFITKVSPAGVILYSTYLGGDDEDRGFAAAVDTAGNVYLTGLSASGNFPVRNPAQSRKRGVVDAFITKISDAASAQATASAASFRREKLAREGISAVFGSDFATITESSESVPLPTRLGNTSITIKDSAGVEHLAPLFFVSPNQINYLIPAGVAYGIATVITLNGNLIVGTEAYEIVPVAPGIFTSSANGQGVPAGLILRVKANGSQSYESLQQFDPATNQFVPIAIDLGPEGEQVFLVLFGTGFRNRSSLSGVTASIGELDTSVLYAGAQSGLVGLDQANLRLSRSLIGRGDVDVVLIADGQISNPVRIRFK